MVVPQNKFHIGELPIISERRIQLTDEYCRIHYGFEGHRIIGPKMIVIHYTAFATLGESYNFMQPDELSAIRDDIQKGGRLNVGTHFLIDRSGEIFRLLPEDFIARHTIGFNHVALSIENVGLDRNQLTGEQVSANAWVIHYLVNKYPSIEFLIGHYEYTNQELPHYDLISEQDSTYRFTDKQDPGIDFMFRVRTALADQYNMILKD
jgi:N-acetyl-anhydromuramyl-L-alanine amidase AmpD